MAMVGFLRTKRHARKCFAEFVLSAYKYRNMTAAANNSCVNLQETESIRTM